MSHFKEMKFLVKDEEHSRQIQKALFGLGYKWWCIGGAVKEIMHTGTQALYADSDGAITHSDRDYFFSQNVEDIPEYTVKEVVSYEIVPVKDEEVIVLAGKVYKKSELEEALSKIKPIGEMK